MPADSTPAESTVRRWLDGSEDPLAQAWGGCERLVTAGPWVTSLMDAAAPDDQTGFSAAMMSLSRACYECLWVCVRFGQCNGMVCCCVCLFVCGCVCWFGFFECLFVCLCVFACQSVIWTSLLGGWVLRRLCIHCLAGWLLVR